MVIVVKMCAATRVQVLDEAVCISHCTNNLGMNPINLPLAMDKKWGKLGALIFVGQQV